MIHLDSLKFSASIRESQEPSLSISAILISSELVDLSNSKIGEIFLNNDISDFTVVEGEPSQYDIASAAINNSHARTSDNLTHAWCKFQHAVAPMLT
tara:strand:+ start:350 stop:640 length:291 start_codon:yes stop_codon:yes gene_type:complete